MKKQTKKKKITFLQFMKIQTRFIIFYCRIYGLDYIEAAEQLAPILRKKLEQKYIIN